MSRVIVVGAGVVGLSCAIRLAEAGLRVDVLARDLPRETTSSVAAAIWYPYLALPQDRVTAWGGRAYAAFQVLAREEGSGVRMLPGTEVHTRPEPDPWWLPAVPRLDRATPPPGPWSDAWSFEAPVIDMGVYLPWLADRLTALGGTLTRMPLAVLPEGGDLVVDCSGLGARLLAGDRAVTPVRGQVVVVEQFGLDRWWLDGGEHPAGSAPPTYVVPRLHEVVVGGTDDVGEWSRTPSPETARAILQRAARLVPEVAAARVVRHKVGLRPARPEIRVERVGDVVHCYGHGGAGVTLSWGCADEVVELATR